MNLYQTKTNCPFFFELRKDRINNKKIIWDKVIKYYDNKIIVLQLSEVIDNIFEEIMDAYGNIIEEPLSLIKVLINNKTYFMSLKDLIFLN